MMTEPEPALSGGKNTGRRSIVRNFRSLVFGRIFAAFSMWLALLILAKLSDPQTVGIYALAQAICVPTAEVAKTGLREIYTSDTTGRHQFGDYFCFRLLTMVVALVLMVLQGFLHGSGTVIVVIVAMYALIRCAELISDMIHGLFQSQEQMEFIGLSLCMLGPASMLLLSLGYWLTGSLLVAVLGQLVASLSVLLLYDMRVARERISQFSQASIRPMFRVPVLRDISSHALPLAIATSLAMVAVYLPRFVVENSMGLPALGYFSAITAFAMSPNRLVNSLGVAVAVRLARQHATGEKASFLRLLLIMVLMVLVSGLLAIFVTLKYGEPILSAVYTSDYGTYSGLLVWATIAAVLRSIADVLKFGMVATRRFWAVCVQFGIVAVVAALASLTLTPRYGLNGAGMAMVVIYAAHLVVVALGLFNSFPRRTGT
jgi:O-antigen/teichoic acid export membrane protein